MLAEWITLFTNKKNYLFYSLEFLSAIHYEPDSIEKLSGSSLKSLSSVYSESNIDQEPIR